MAAPNFIRVTSPAQERIIQYHRRSYELMNSQWDFREQMRQTDLAYIREQDWTTENWRARLSNRYGNSDKIQNITIPVIEPQVRAAVGYQAAIFLTSYPIFPVVAAPQFMDAAKQMQALIEENSIRGGWARELLLFFTDGFKYNLSAIELSWEKKVTAAVETDPSFSNKEGKPVDVVWSGNMLERWDPYNTYWDTRVHPYEVSERGEFAGHTKIYSKTALKTLMYSLGEDFIKANEKKAFESPSMLNVASIGSGVAGYYVPQINPNVIIDPTLIDIVDWDAWVGIAPNNNRKGIQYKGIYEVSFEYVRIMPSEFDIQAPAANTPQVWKMIIVNHAVVIYAKRCTNAHERIPVFFGQPSEDGLGYQTKSLSDNALPFQQVSSAIMNGVLAARRRAVTDRVLYDPSRVSEAHINNPNPSAKIPVRPSAYGKPVSESVYQFPYRDDQSAIGMQEIQQVVGLGNILNGQNSARQGQFVKGNKTDGQWETTMSNATTKDQLTALLYETQVFTPMKEAMKLNYLQYQGGVSVYSDTYKENVKIDPVVLRRAVLNFKITDGLLPSEKVLSGDQQKVAMQVIGSSPALAQGYNVAQLFSYILKTENVDFSAFEKSPAQVAYEQALAAWNNAANMFAQKGVMFSQPQPKPQEYGFDPNTVNPAMAANTAPISLPPQGV